MLDLAFKISKKYCSGVIVIFLLSVGIVFSLNLPIIIKFALAFAIIMYGIWIVWRFGLLRSKHSLIGIKHLTGKKWLLHTPHAVVQGILCGESTVTNLICILRFKISGKTFKKSCIILRDSLPNDAYRKLLVRLRMGS